METSSAADGGAVEPRFLHVRDWPKYQTYIRRGTPWIKCYTDLLRHRQFEPLNLHRRGLLFCLWLEYAASPHGKPLDALGLPADVRRLNRHISASARQADIDELVNRGWLFYSEYERLGDALEHLTCDVAVTQNAQGPRDKFAISDEVVTQNSPQTRMVAPSFSAPEGETEGEGDYEPGTPVSADEKLSREQASEVSRRARATGIKTPEWKAILWRVASAKYTTDLTTDDLPAIYAALDEWKAAA